MPASSWIVRALRDTDFQRLASFRCANPGESWTRSVEEMIQRDLYKRWTSFGRNHPDLSIFVVADETAARLLGVVACSISWPDTAEFPSTGLGQIPLLGVDPGYRRRGIATALKQAAMDALAGAGCSGVASQVHKRNLPMQGDNSRVSAETTQLPGADDFLLTVVRFD